MEGRGNEAYFADCTIHLTPKGLGMSVDALVLENWDVNQCPALKMAIAGQK